MERDRFPDQQSIILPQRTLLVLCGPAGSGKSTFAQSLVNHNTQKGLRATSIVSSDQCRALVSDDASNQQANRDAFDLFHYIIHKRMFQGRFTIADSTALQAEARHRMLGLARHHGYHTCIIVLNIPAETCIRQDLGRARVVGEQVITYHVDQLQLALATIPGESWNEIYILEETKIRNFNVEIQ